MGKIQLALALFFVTQASAFAQLDISAVDAGIYRGPHPQSEEDMQDLKAKGIKTILSLQIMPWTIHAEKEWAEREGFTFESAPLEASPIPPSTESVNLAVSKLTNPDLRPIYVHCTWGMHRTSLVVAIYRVFYDHWTPQAASQEMVHFGFNPFNFFVHGLWHYFEEVAGPEHSHDSDLTQSAAH